MKTYRGVVRGRTVVLPDDADVEDGQIVEVQVPDESVDDPTDSAWRERLFRDRLREIGLLGTPERPPVQARREVDHQPIDVRGRPLSEEIIRDRR